MSYWASKVIIAGRAYPRFIGGPLDGITDSPFRRLVREFSKEELLYTEMRHVGCITADKTGVRSLKFEQSERPLNYQVSANKIEFIESACERILAAGVDMLDLNVGCPAHNVIKSGCGSALMADLPRLETILKKFRSLLRIPFTVKIRAGFKHKNALDVAKLIQDCGADALAIHPRLQTQKFEGQPDYTLAAQVKAAVAIPVIISGGVVNWKTAQLAYKQTGVDGFLISRGIWACPWKLYELQEHAAGRSFEPTPVLIGTYALKHFDYMRAYYGTAGLYNFRKHLPFYLRGFADAARIRARLVTSTCAQEVQEGLKNFFGIHTPQEQHESGTV